MNITQANAVNVLVRDVLDIADYAGCPVKDNVAAALRTLVPAAYKTLHAGISPGELEARLAGRA